MGERVGKHKALEHFWLGWNIPENKMQKCGKTVFSQGLQSRLTSLTEFNRSDNEWVWNLDQTKSMAKIPLIFLGPRFQSHHTVSKCWPFLKAANIIECFIHLYIHIQTNWNVFEQGTVHRWLCCQVKMGCCSSTHTVDESMDKETHCSAGRQ